MSLRDSSAKPAETPPFSVPDSVLEVVTRLQEAGHRTLVVGGALRDALAGVDTNPSWDLATSARPQDVQRLFPRTVPLGIEHGTVKVLVDGADVEVTTFRADLQTDGRHAVVRFSDDVFEDLARRDFTINALAWDPRTGELLDPHGGRADLARRVLQTVGDADRRFAEDYLRLLRGARFAARFGLAVADDLRRAMREHAAGTARLSGERVRDELLRTLREAPRPSVALRLLRDTGVLAHVLPELEACFGVHQNRWHADDVGEHILQVVDAVPRRFPFLRVVALLHDVGKPAAKIWEPARSDWIFRGHDEIGAEMARAAMERLRFPRREVDRSVHLIRVHMDLFPREAGDAAVRRWLQRVGEENVRDLFRLHFADWRGNRAKEQPPAELRYLYRRVRGVIAQRSALTLADLAVGGDDLIALGLPPGPEYRRILGGLLQLVVEDPAANERIRLLEEARRLAGEPGAVAGGGAARS